MEEKTEMMPSEYGIRIECGVYADDPPRATPQVYMACLGCYNEGRIHGQWVDADDLADRWTMYNNFDDDQRAPDGDWVPHAMTNCARDYHEEWAIHDYDGVPNLGEHPDIVYLTMVMRCVEEHGDPFLEWFNLDPHNKSHHDDLSEAFQQAYCGEWDSPKAFAEEHAEELGYIPSIHEKNPNPLFAFVDFEWWWKSDLRHAYNFSNGHVFRGDV